MPKQQITKQRTEIQKLQQNKADNSATDSKSKKETSNNNDDAKQQITKQRTEIQESSTKRSTRNKTKRLNSFFIFFLAIIPSNQYNDNESHNMPS